LFKAWSTSVFCPNLFKVQKQRFPILQGENLCHAVAHPTTGKLQGIAVVLVCKVAPEPG